MKFSIYTNRRVFVMYFKAAGVKCRVAAIKRLPVLHHSANYIFILFGIIEPILVILKIEYGAGWGGIWWWGGRLCSLANQIA